jgi:hypothetical protein
MIFPSRKDSTLNKEITTMTDTATPATGPVDAPASLQSVMAEFEAGGDAPVDAVESVVQELVNEAEGTGEPSTEEPTTEEDATDPAEPADEAADAEPDEPAPEEKTYTVKVNGEEIVVPESELLNGYSRTADYKQKTAALAEERRQVEAQKASLEPTLKAEYANQLEEATNLFAQYDPVLQEARQINWEALKAQDPAAFVQAQDAVQARLTAIQQMKQQVESARTQSQAAQQQQAEQERAQRFDAAADKIVEAIPELADEAKFADFAKSNIGFLRDELGFTPDEIASSLDHRVLTLANDARQWRAHKAAQKSLPEKRVVPKSAVKPLTTDGSGSRASTPRFPANAGRDRKADWVVNQLLSEE